MQRQSYWARERVGSAKAGLYGLAQTINRLPLTAIGLDPWSVKVAAVAGLKNKDGYEQPEAQQKNAEKEI